MEKIILIGLIVGVFSSLLGTGYKKPGKKILDIYKRESNPYVVNLTNQNKALEFFSDSKQTLEALADPTIELAGKKLSERLNAPIDNYPITKINIIDLESKERINIQFPESIRIRSTDISPNYKKIAVSYEKEDGIFLAVADLNDGTVQYFDDFRINDCFGYSGFQWKRNSKELIITTIPKHRKEKPIRSTVPVAPVVEETYGKKSTVRTYQNLLTSKEDEILFDYYFQSELTLVNIKKNKIKTIGEPKIYNAVSISPDGKYFLITEIHKPYSYQVPYYYFPKTFFITDDNGKIVRVFLQRPLQDQIPIGGTIKGPRRMQWKPLEDATLIWREALDEGNPKKEVAFRDQIMMIKHPLEKKPQVVFQTKHRFSGFEFFEQKDLCLAYEYDRDNLWFYTYFFNFKTKEYTLISDRSINDVYGSLGDLSAFRTKKDEVLAYYDNGWVFYNSTKGATPKGNFPFLIKYNLFTQEKQELFKCRKDKYEYARGFINKNEILVSCESKHTPRNYYKFNLKTKEREVLTNYENPYPEITNLKKELIQYKRKDGVQLSGTLYLPDNYKKGMKVPLVLHAYPEEFTDKSTAGQISGSANRFTSFWGASIKYFCLAGYAVLVNASMPIVGDPETVNDTFIQQLEDNVAAAINHLEKKAIIDSKKVGIIGHSYGAFMVANVLAHTDLCAAGIAKSGAYNRTLTPFGFQSERRTFWEAKDFYMKVSPFANADKINEPLLLIHGEKDPNSGTYPIQSKRLYQAIKGNSGTAKLVLLPLEGHSYVAEESQLHVLAEMIAWFDRFLK